MATFRDRLGRDWTVTLVMGDLRRVREATGLALGQLLAQHEALTRVLFGDPEAFGRVVWILVERQARERGIDETAFADGFDRDTVEAAAMAVVDAVVDFTQPRTVAPTVKAKVRGLAATAEAAMRTAAESIATDAPTTLKPSAGNSAAPPGLTPGP